MTVNGGGEDGAQVPLASRALDHESKEVRLVGLRLTALVSTTAASRETAMDYGLLERITSTEDFGNDERECCWTNKHLTRLRKPNLLDQNSKQTPGKGLRGSDNVSAFNFIRIVPSFPPAPLFLPLPLGVHMTCTALIPIPLL